MALWISGRWDVSYWNVQQGGSPGATWTMNGKHYPHAYLLIIHESYRAIMFHIGVATQHPPLPDKNELSDLGIAFLRECLTIDAMTRPSAEELMRHRWIVQFMETLRSYEEEEMATSPPADVPSEQDFAGATVARQAAILREKESEAIASSPVTSEVTTPFDAGEVEHV